MAKYDRARLAGAALVLMLAAAPAQAAEHPACRLPMTATDATAVLKSLTNSAEGSFDDKGVKAAVKFIQRDFADMMDGSFMSSGFVESSFTFSSKDVSGIIEKEKIKALSVPVLIQYSAGAGMLTVNVMGQQEKPQTISLTTKQKTFSDVTVTEMDNDSFSVSGSESISNLGFGMNVMEMLSSQKRVIRARADVPMLRRTVLECNRERGTVGIGTELVLDFDMRLAVRVLQIDTTIQKGKQVALNLSLDNRATEGAKEGQQAPGGRRGGSSINGSAGRNTNASTRTVVNKQAFDGMVRAFATGSGLRSAIVIDPTSIREKKRPVLNFAADLVLGLDLNDQPLSARIDTHFEKNK